MSSTKLATDRDSKESPVENGSDWVNDDFEIGLKDVPENLTSSPPAPATQPAKEGKTALEVGESPAPKPDNITIPASGPPLVEEGMSCVAKSLYEGPKKCECCINWVEKTAEEIEAEKVLTAKVHGDAAVLTRQRNGHGGEDTFVLHSIVVQSPLLKVALQKVLKDYPGVSPELDEVVFEAPFEPLLHRWNELVKAGKNESSTETRKHIKVLCDVLEPEFEKFRTTVRECHEYGVVKFDSLWAIFSPGDLLYAHREGQECAVRLRDAAYVITHTGGQSFELQCELVDFDGIGFGYGNTEIQIEKYRGTANTADLAAMPLDMVKDKLNVKDRLIKRGRLFESLRGYNFKHYIGPVTLYNDQYQSMKETTTVDDRVIIDARAYYQFCIGQQREGLVSLEADASARTSRISNRSVPRYDYINVVPRMPSGPFHSGASSGMSTTQRTRAPREATPQILDEFGRATNNMWSHNLKHHALTEDQRILCVPFVRGFLLRRKQWAKFNIEGITDITWNEDAFESLVLPSNQKDLLLAFAEGQANGSAKFDDFIRGKGKGIVMLLSGAPGVGKTLTAESVAETMRVPLYTLSAGELGVYSHELERTLKDTLEKCTLWNAILLLDEADVFLEARSAHDLQRNAMVSVFLRLLEYYEGIMFLTTNRVDAFDPAFESRIDVAFEYDVLGSESRRQVWHNFLVRLPEDEKDISPKDLESLVEVRLNGRQIKSAVKTAKMLAARKKEKLALAHLKTVLELRAYLLRDSE